MKTLILMAFALALSACSSPMLKLNQGMTRDEVIAKIGQPDERTTNGDNELMTYRWYDGNGIPHSSGVILSSGKVARFGDLDQLFPRDPASQGTRCVTMPIGGMLATKCQ